MTGDLNKSANGVNVTSNLDQALESLGAQDTARSLNLTRSLDEAIGKLSTSRAFQPQPEETVEAVIRVADGPEDMEKIYQLAHDAYVEKGYKDSQPDRRLLYNAEMDQSDSTTVLIVEGAEVVIGSVSITLDGPDGLPVDRDFKATCDAIRAENRSLASVWRLITRHGYADERRLVMALIGEIVQIGINEGLQTVVCALNPKHEHFYRRLLNMRRMAYARAMKGLKNAPGVCMRCDAEDVPEWWTR